MDTSQVLSIVATLLAFFAITPAAFSARYAWKQTRIAQEAATAAASDADTAKRQADAAIAQVAAIREQVIVAREQAQAAKAQADAAGQQVVAMREQATIAREQATIAREQAIAARDQAHAAIRAAGAAEGAQKAQAIALLFELDRALRGFDDVHTALRPGGPGWFGDGDKLRRDKWVPVEAYMGTFERIQAMVTSGLLDRELVKDLYGYRIANIVADDTIYEHKLVHNADGWRRFIALWEETYTGTGLSYRSPAQRRQDEERIRARRGSPVSLDRFP
jgi:hypothetical protein